MGVIISLSTCSFILGVKIGAGEYAPIPPVLGPVSFSPILLWSWALSNETKSSPSQQTK